MAKLKRKTKVPTPSELADSINQISADAEGITLKQWYKRQAIRNKAQETYKKTHWVNELTDAQKFFIVTTTDVPHHYMDLPLSKGNETSVAIFKKTNKNYQNWVVKNNEFMKKEFELKAKIDIKTKIAEAKSKIAGSNIERIFADIKRTTEPLRRLQAQLDKQQEPLRKITQNLVGDYQKIGRKLRMTPDAVINGKEVEFKYRSKYGDEREIQEKNRLVEASNGLNTLMNKNKLKRPLDIAGHYLKTYNEPSKADYVVDSFDNAVALANATGMLPQRMFKLICDDLVKRKKHYEEQAFIADGIKVEEIINLWENKRQKNKTYTYSMFYKSKERKLWSTKYSYDWKNYKRFMEDFPKWIKIFSAKAHQRAESDAEMLAEFLSQPDK